MTESRARRTPTVSNKEKVMGVITTTKRTVQATVIFAVLAYVGFHVLTKLDTSGDKRATITVTLGVTGRDAIGAVHTYINGAHRTSESIDLDKTEFSETFWVRPGETAQVTANLTLGKASLTCVILMDGVIAAGPVTTKVEHDAICNLSATA